MSQAVTTPPTTLFLERLIRFLMPFFLDIAPDIAAARAEIIETLASYGASTRAELLNAAQIIAYGLSALDALSEAKTTEMSNSMRLRFRGCANGLNRAAQQSEKTLAKRLACTAPTAAEPVTNPEDDMSEEDYQAMLEETKANIATCRRLLGASIDPSPQPMTAEQAERSDQLASAALSMALQSMQQPAQPTPSA